MPSDPSALHCVLDARASLGECPVWSVAEQVLYWVDINAPALHRFDPATGADTAMPMPESIGCFALRERGRLVIAQYPVPAQCPTMCAFGGPDLRTLYVTSARQLRSDEELARLPQSGGLFAMAVAVPGLPEPRFAG